MKVICRQCASTFTRKSKADMDFGLPNICCGPCFRLLTFQPVNKIHVDGERIVPYVRNTGTDEFLSSWEPAFEDICRKKLDIPTMYEPLKFRLSDGSAYVPDFLTWPAQFGSGKHGPFIEVKGRWLKDAKKKFKMFKAEYPDLHIYLIDDKLLSILKRTGAK